MRFTAWRAPSHAQLELRSLSRHLHSLTQEQTRIKNRMHVARGSRTTAVAILEDLKRELAHIAKRLLRLRRQSMLLVRADSTLCRHHDLLVTVPGIGSLSAVQLLGELTLLSPNMTLRQWVAHSGLDPAHQQSGTSLHKPSRISRHGNRHLRRALYMPALVAARHDPCLTTFYQTLLARQKAKMQALIAVARKLLHAIYGVLKTQTPYQGEKLFPQLQIHTA
jgi:transposase